MTCCSRDLHLEKRTARSSDGLSHRLEYDSTGVCPGNVASVLQEVGELASSIVESTAESRAVDLSRTGFEVGTVNPNGWRSQESELRRLVGSPDPDLLD
jgi:hypothetical protein